MSALKKSGKAIGYSKTKSLVDQNNLDLNDIAFQINKFGLKGPDVSPIKKDCIIRILTIGDSCTFGEYIDKLSYPRQLERLLNTETNKKYEVINAGHLGINLQKVLMIIDEWFIFNPDIITIYLGWNHTILRGDPNKDDWMYEKYALYRFYYHGLVNRTNLKGWETRFTNNYDLYDPILETLADKSFETDLKNLELIVNKIRNNLPNIKIALITLPGLYSTHKKPTTEEIEKGFSTAFSDNLAVWPYLSEQYNEELRKFATKQNLILYDLEKFAEKTFQPKTNFFSDPVHPSPLGHLKIAEFLSESIKSEFP